MDLLTSFEGRIRRRDYWLGILGLIAINVALVFLVVPALLVLGGFGFILATLITYAINLFAAGALMTKRLHDRDKPMVPWLLIFLGVPMLVSLAQTLGIGFESVAVPAGQVEGPPSGTPTFDGDGMAVAPVPNALGAVLLAVGFFVSLWALIELGFLRGTVGPNRFGPDPRGGSA